LYPFGHGLSYTTFAYTNVTVNGTSRAGPAVNLTFDVRNTGTRTGDEVIQVYVSSDQAKEPLKSLQYFRRINLPPSNVPTRLHVVLPQSAFTIFNEAKGVLELGKGKFNISVGGSSAKNALQTVTVNFSHKLSVAVIVAIIVAGIVLVIVIVAAVCFCRKRNRGPLEGKSTPLLRD
jgi:beta-glucosidase